MKLAAFGFGRKLGNTEVFLKEALMGAQELGVTVEFYRMNEFKVHTCTACSPQFCPSSRRDIHDCPYQDDTPFLADCFLDSDGILIGAPVYALSPGSMFFAFRDRVFGPKMDVAKKELGFPDAPWIAGRMRARPGGLISVGGALTEHWTSSGLPNLYTATFSAQTEVVDMLNIHGVADPGAATMEVEYLQKARRLGRNVAEAMLSGDHRWRGEQVGLCPRCHLNLLTYTPGNDQVVCPVCGITGEIHAVGGQVQISWPEREEYRRDDRLSVGGKKLHLMEIRDCAAAYTPHKAEAMKKLQVYREFSACEVHPPR